MDEHELNKKVIKKIFFMELQLFGINHKTAKLSDREMFIINDSNQEDFINFIDKTFGKQIESCFALSTCNRTEVYLYADAFIAKEVMLKTAEFMGTEDLLQERFYIFQGLKAKQHMCSVASGLDSQILGEQEIFGQFKQAAQFFTHTHALNGNLKFLTDEVISVAKAVRTDTNIGLNPLSVSGLSYKIVREIFEEPESQRVLLIGAGQMAQGIAEHFYYKGIKDISAVNRTRKNLIINKDISLETHPLSKLQYHLEQTDILISSIASLLPLVGKGLIENVLRVRKNRPILLIDLGVPRNIEYQVKELENAYLFTMEDIEMVTQENFEERSFEAKRGHQLILSMINGQDSQLEERQVRNDIYQLLKEIILEIDAEFLEEIVNSSDPKETLKFALQHPDERLERLSSISPNVLSSMIKEIKSA